MESIRSNRLGSRRVDLGFWKFIKLKANEENISMLELQRRIAKANNIQLKQPKKRKDESPERYKFGF